ncbi:Replication protein A 14 kDa subunit [Orchesella cincta]|uniref:Replication protein A 14 kDa subunit n=1 Tax=Orchesella cincta TaxID=48709 RepID=A0A1D2MDT1_ORCCI|nr:Replication protein A 14 kDa subunit [Orchesella cincta]
MADEHVSPHRARVNGAFLHQYHGKPVCLLGTIIRADGGGTSFQVKASDGNQINVRLRSPISEPLTGLVEVYGIGQGKNLVVADSFTTFPDSLGNNFEMNTYNEAVKLLHSVEGNLNPWIPT